MIKIFGITKIHAAHVLYSISIKTIYIYACKYIHIRLLLDLL